MTAKDDGTGAEIVVVGARCAGAPLATHLARAGRSVVLLDAAKLPSDQTTSTHLIHPPGLEELNTLGVADTVRAASPASNSSPKASRSGSIADASSAKASSSGRSS